MSKAVLGALNLTGQHARWWSKVYGSGIRHIEILHRLRKINQPADALSRRPVLPAPVDDGTSKEVQIAHISSDDTISISTLLQVDPNNVTSSSDSRHEAIMLQKLSIMLLSSAQKITYYAFENCPLFPKLCYHNASLLLYQTIFIDV